MRGIRIVALLLRPLAWKRHDADYGVGEKMQEWRLKASRKLRACTSARLGKIIYRRGLKASNYDTSASSCFAPRAQRAHCPSRYPNRSRATDTKDFPLGSCRNLQSCPKQPPPVSQLIPARSSESSQNLVGLMGRTSPVLLAFYPTSSHDHDSWTPLIPFNEFPPA